ncbi:FoF1 ATP synthase subunit a [Chakrabartyella piscis]|uniref:FoF1 ATP synthase subunit A n=1 Tax=Chakrabartyella piscis TaxID=2918914 RepID=UPI002958D493|nr:FoF1 ATP synthase subunit a [Chakrabartyella piscis]
MIFLDSILMLGLLALGLLLANMGFFWRRNLKKSIDQKPENKSKLTIATAMFLGGGWFFLGQLLTLIFGEKNEEIAVEIWAPRTEFLGMDFSTTVLISWVILAICLILALLFRLLVVPKMTDNPKGIQNVMEMAVEAICKFTHSNVGDLGNNLPAYLFSTFVFLIGCAAVELMGVRAPTADITMTFALSIITFFLINYYGFKKKGFGGRIKSMASPNAMILPIKIVSDLAVPISLACRLFGNMLAGMIVMELLYVVLGNHAIAIPSVAGLYFNVAHPLIQAYIFVTLTLTFIGEATEEAHA